MFLLGQARPILVWPEFSWIPVINGTIFVALLLVVGYYLERRFRKSIENRAALRAKILKKLPLTYMNGRDVIQIHSFLDHTSVSILQKIAESQSWFQEIFLPEFALYLAHQGELPAWRDTIIFKRLQHLVRDLGPHPKKITPVVFLTDGEEAFPGFCILTHRGPTSFRSRSVRKYSQKNSTMRFRFRWEISFTFCIQAMIRNGCVSTRRFLV